MELGQSINSGANQAKDHVSSLGFPNITVSILRISIGAIIIYFQNFIYYKV